MTNVEIYDTSNSELSSDEYSHEEDDDALMEAAVSKQASPSNSQMKAVAEAVAKPMPKPDSEKPDEELTDLTAADAPGKDKIAEAAAVVVAVPQPPPSTRAEAIRQIRRMQAAPYRQPNIYHKRRSLTCQKINDQRERNYLFLIKRYKATIRRRRYTSSSRSVSYSRSNSRSLSRSRSRSRSLDRSCSSDRSRSASQSPELICLDDTENEDSPEKPEEAKAANVTPIKMDKAKIMKPPQFEQQEKKKSNENGTSSSSSSVLEEFLMIKEPKQPSQAGIELDKLTASLGLEQENADTTLVQQQQQVEEQLEEAEACQAMAVDATLKRRRSVTPPLSNDKRRIVDDDDDDPIDFQPVIAQNPVEATPVLKMQPPKAPQGMAPAANPNQSQPSFRLSSPYTLAFSPGPNHAKQTLNLAAVSHSLNTPPAVAMEISYPTDILPHITKSNIVMAPPQPEQPAASVTVPVYGSPAYASPVNWASPAQAAHVQNEPPRAAHLPSGAVQASFSTQRVLPGQVGPPRAAGPTRVPLQVNSPRATTATLQADHPPRVIDTPSQTPAQPQQQPPVQVHPEQPQLNANSFAVPQQPQPRRSETVSTQTQASQPETAARQKSAAAAPDLKNSDANFHYRLKELFPELDTIFKDKLDAVGADRKTFINEIEADIKTLDNLLAQKEEEWNRLYHLRCMKSELRGRVDRMERVSVIKKLLPSVINKGCSTTELYEIQESLLGEHMLKVPFGASLDVGQFLNNMEVNQSDIQRLRGVMGLREKATAASLRNFEENQQQQQQHYRRNSLPVRQALDREFLDATEEIEELSRNCDLPPVNKRPRLQRGHDRYHPEMRNSTPNLAAASSSFSSHNKLTVPETHSYYKEISALENFLENESQMKPLYNSSPMVSQRNLANRQYDELHSTSYRNDEEATKLLDKVRKKLQRKETTTSTNGTEEKVCQNCQVYKAEYECVNCLNQWYCSRKCQLAAWNSHSNYCGK